MNNFSGNKLFLLPQCLFLGFLFSLFFILLNACSGKKDDSIIIPHSDSIPGMSTLGVTSYISDSGLIRYKIVTDEWLIFDKVKSPYWYFPKGLYVEQFDSTLKADAHIECDTAYFFEQKQLWRLVGNVHLENLQEEKFDTEELFWDQKKEIIYSDKYIHIEQKERIITGMGFDSNQSMSAYTIRKPQGIFPIENDLSASSDSIPVVPAENDTISPNRKDKKE